MFSCFAVCTVPTTLLILIIQKSDEFKMHQNMGQSHKVFDSFCFTSGYIIIWSEILKARLFLIKNINHYTTGTPVVKSNIQLVVSSRLVVK